MSISLPDARELSDEVMDAIRLRALWGVQNGRTETETAMLLGVSRETVSRWWTAYAAHGLEALPGDRTGRPVGSGRTLSDEQSQHIQELIDECSPEDLGIAAALWTRKAVRDLIRNEYGIDIATRTVGTYLERWGYTAKVPSRRSKRQDPDEVAEWLEKTYPEIERRAAREGAEIHWCDETGAAADSQSRKGYSRRGEPAVIEMPAPHIRLNLVSTISNEGEVHFHVYKEMMTGTLFIKFLEQLLTETTAKIFLILDRLRAHQTQEVMDWVAERADRIELFWLPRYSPELNPNEYLNNDLKGAIGAEGLPNDKNELRSRIEGFMGKLLNLPEHVRSYFQGSWWVFGVMWGLSRSRASDDRLDGVNFGRLGRDHPFQGVGLGSLATVGEPRDTRRTRIGET
jgi:transposase